jgi:hypothetical protein
MASSMAATEEAEPEPARAGVGTRQGSRPLKRKRGLAEASGRRKAGRSVAVASTLARARRGGLDDLVTAVLEELALGGESGEYTIWC